MSTQAPTESLKIRLLKWFVIGFGILLLVATFVMFAVAIIIHKKSAGKPAIQAEAVQSSETER